MDIAVVLVGYNRPESIRRLYNSVASSSYEREVDLVFSIDKSDSQQYIMQLIDSLEWRFGRKIVRAFDERLGLRKHILACGDLTEVYDAVVVLEDDIVVSESFFNYVVSAINFVGDDENIAGISLYAPSINEMAMLPFVPKRTGYDNYYLQSAQSWGQCWTRRMWQDFRKWYDQWAVDLKSDTDMPCRIYSWPESSWKKYYMKYLVSTGKTFFYPYDSLSSNYSDVGQHNKVVTPHFQVPLISGKSEYRFGAMTDVPNYDVFYERSGFEYEGEALCLDLYGTRKVSTSRFLLSCRKIGARVLETYGLTYRPQEDNYLKKAAGCDLYLYDLGENYQIGARGNAGFKLSNYHTNLDWRDSLRYGMRTFISRALHKIKR